MYVQHSFYYSIIIIIRIAQLIMWWFKCIIRAYVHTKSDNKSDDAVIVFLFCVKCQVAGNVSKWFWVVVVRRGRRGVVGYLTPPGLGVVDPREGDVQEAADCFLDAGEEEAMAMEPR